MHSTHYTVHAESSKRLRYVCSKREVMFVHSAGPPGTKTDGQLMRYRVGIDLASIGSLRLPQ